MSSTRVKVARVGLIVVCAGVLVAICGLLVRQWGGDSVGGRIAKIVILLVWLWASYRMISKALK